MLVLLWLFQTVFLESFYKAIKTQNIKSTAENITTNINNENLDTLLSTLAQRNDTCIRIVDENFANLYSYETTFECTIHKMGVGEMEAFRQKARQEGGTAFELISRDVMQEFRGKVEKKGWNMPPPGGNMRVENMVYVRLVERADGSQVMVMLNSTITPVGATVETLRIQLIYVTVILLVLCVGLALLLSRQISKPIIRINRSAKELAKGQYDTTFSGGGYREISELTDTLNYAAKELSKVEGLRRELIANISHDLRTPLTMITGYAEVMRDIPGENTPENVQIIIDEAKRLTDLVNDLMDISKLQSGAMTLSLSECNLTETVRDIMARYMKLTEQDGYHIKFICDGEAMVSADEIKISQVIYNLINNAINYTGPDKNVTVCQSVRDGFVKLEIIDTGDGIAPEEIPYIWDRYYKVDKAHKRAMIGTGLGLSIVKNILDLHGGAYGVISTVGQGSIFWFELNTLEPKKLK
ncbi:HAMP domain-containing histidine kinase [Oscillospiraceae bacterium NSJ-54]|uniref:histidine kinase n=2 Tax=Zongyangia hominis TaxID=2763677 RepID=A0A926EA86_9FIRM|nr:HAMP domain-containing histidine kinase [Zongyangia hominis]